MPVNIGNGSKIYILDVCVLSGLSFGLSLVNFWRMLGTFVSNFENYEKYFTLLFADSMNEGDDEVMSIYL